jgi:MarR family 2-MHQ and catechol resistance regulon transcriptional repressor
METGPHIRLLLWKANKAVEKVERDSIDGTGLLLSEFTVMEVLLHKGPLPINAIGEKVLLTSGSMTAAVNRLEDKGLATRVQDPSDHRCFYVHLTSKGAKVIRKAYGRHARNLENVAAALSPDERDELARLLKKYGRHADEVYAAQDDFTTKSYHQGLKRGVQ